MSADLAADAVPPARVRTRARTQWSFWGRAMVLPYTLVFLIFVLFPVGYGLWLARHPASYERLFADPIFFRTAINTLVFIVVAINLKMIVALGLSGFFVQKRWWISVLAAIFIIPWAVPSIPTILSVRFMLNPEWGVINSLIFRLTGMDGPNWLNDPTLALSFSMLMHIWKSLPFWTLILVAGRLASDRCFIDRRKRRVNALEIDPGHGFESGTRRHREHPGDSAGPVAARREPIREARVLQRARFDLRGHTGGAEHVFDLLKERIVHRAVHCQTVRAVHRPSFTHDEQTTAAGPRDMHAQRRFEPIEIGRHGGEAGVLRPLEASGEIAIGQRKPPGCIGYRGSRAGTRRC
jgi:hypothetical protein